MYLTAVAKNWASIGALSSEGRHGMRIRTTERIVNNHETIMPTYVPRSGLPFFFNAVETLHARKAPTKNGPHLVCVGRYMFLR